MDPGLYSIAWGFVLAGIVIPFLLLGIFLATFSGWLWSSFRGSPPKLTNSTGRR